MQRFRYIGDVLRHGRHLRYHRRHHTVLLRGRSLWPTFPEYSTLLSVLLFCTDVDGAALVGACLTRRFGSFSYLRGRLGRLRHRTGALVLRTSSVCAKNGGVFRKEQMSSATRGHWARQRSLGHGARFARAMRQRAPHRRGAFQAAALTLALKPTSLSMAESYGRLGSKAT